MEMAIWEHLDELRGRLIKVLIFVALLTIGSFLGADWMLAWLLKPAPFQNQSLTSLQPAGVFVQSLRLALLAGVILALPILLHQVWRFISPGLQRKEQRVLLISLYAGTLLFGVGVLFAYYYVVPNALDFFWKYSQHLGVTPNWTIDYYLNFVLMFLISFGIAFELPLVLLLLIRFGVLTSEWLAAKRPHVIVLIAILAAALTPPDVVSQLMLGVPLWLLFEISLFLSKWIT